LLTSYNLIHIAMPTKDHVMIRRVWRGWTTRENADTYEALLRTEIFPGIFAKSVAGLERVELLRRPLGPGEVEFVTIMSFTPWEAVKAFRRGPRGGLRARERPRRARAFRRTLAALRATRDRRHRLRVSRPARAARAGRALCPLPRHSPGFQLAGQAR
jgi:hypothetical protein